MRPLGTRGRTLVAPAPRVGCIAFREARGQFCMPGRLDGLHENPSGKKESYFTNVDRVDESHDQVRPSVLFAWHGAPRAFEQRRHALPGLPPSPAGAQLSDMRRLGPLVSRLAVGSSDMESIAEGS